MRFNTGSYSDKDYEKAYVGNLSQKVKDKCKEFSQTYFKECNKGFGKKNDDIHLVLQKTQEIETELSTSGDEKMDYINYLEFLIENKGNYEFMIPYYHICAQENYTPKDNIVIHEDTHTFGLMGTVNDILHG